jgi:hypothetical protein
MILASCAGAIFVVSACARDNETAAAPAAAPAAAVDVEVTVLPSNLVLHSRRDKLIAIRSVGEIAWELALPNQDVIAARVAAGLNSSAYVRGQKGLYAATPDGKWQWTAALPLERTQRSRAANAPVALSDSTVALVVGDEIVSYDHQGTARWRLKLPEGRASGPLTAGMDGSVLVPTPVGIYSINPAGAISWRRAAGG